MTDQLVEAIKKALAEDADESTRRRGADACRSLLAALDAKPGQPLVTPPQQPAVVSPLATAAQALGSAPPSTVLDALIAKLRSELPEGSPDSGRTKQNAEVTLRIPYIAIPSHARSKP